MRLLDFPMLALEVLYNALVLVVDLGQLAVLLDVLALEFVDLVVVLLSLRLKEFKLLLEGLVPGGLHELEPASGILVLLFERLDDLLLHGELVLHLSSLLAVSLVQIRQAVSEDFDLLILLSELFAHLLLELLMELADLLLGLISFLPHSVLQLVLLDLVEVLQLSQALLGPLLHCPGVGVVELLLLLEVLLVSMGLEPVLVLELLEQEALAGLRCRDLRCKRASLLLEVLNFDRQLLLQSLCLCLFQLELDLELLLRFLHLAQLRGKTLDPLLEALDL